MRPVSHRLPLEPVGDLSVLRAAREEREPANMAANLLFPLDHHDLMPTRGGEARVLETRRAAADDERLPGRLDGGRASLLPHSRPTTGLYTHCTRPPRITLRQQ